MADFRKIFYALAMVALFAGLSAPAFGQQDATCQAGAAAPVEVRGEGRAELVSDILIRCTGGISTPPGTIVPPVNIRVQLSTFITSQLLGSGGENNEVLLIIDEPNSGRYFPDRSVSNGGATTMLLGETGERPILACGDVGAPDNSPSGPNVCRTIAPSHPSRTYDGLPNGYTGQDNAGLSRTCDGVDGRPASGSYGCGRPNIFQGHYLGAVGAGGTNTVEFSGVPFDPPGTAKFNSALADGNAAKIPWVRTFRIVNLRVDASSTAADDIFASVTISGNIHASFQNTENIRVASNELNAFVNPTVSGLNSFVQCEERDLISLDGIRNNARLTSTPTSLPTTYIRFAEGFEEAWKTKSWSEIQANSVDGGTGRYGAYNEGFSVPSGYIRQNVPGAIYHTESGFTAAPSPTGIDPAGVNPPVGTGFAATIFANQTISNNTGIAGAGLATAGTRLQIEFGSVPAGVTLYTPEVVYLTRSGTNIVTGMAIRNTATDPVNGSFVAPTTPNPTQWLAVGSGTKAVYEMFYVDPFAQEDLTVPIGIETDINQLPQTLPNNGAVTVRGGLAPVGSPIIPLLSSHATGDLPRFVENLQGGDTVFTLQKCNCNLLFPFVSNQAHFDTGIAIANTSKDPAHTSWPVAQRDSVFTNTLAQDGIIKLWYFGKNDEPANNQTLVQFTQTSNKLIRAGEVATFTLASDTGLGLGNISNGALNSTGAGYAKFSGYMIAKSEFQYCHGFAFFSNKSLLNIAGLQSTSVGYLALVMDPTSFVGSWTSGGSVTIRKASPRTNNTVSDGLDQ